MRYSHLSAAVAFFVAAALVVAGCGPRYDLDDVRARADEMSQRVMEAYYNADAYGEELDVAAIVAGYPDLDDPGLARYVGSLRDRATDPVERKRLEYLYYDIVGTIVWNDLVSSLDEIANIESAGSVTVDGEEIAYRDLGNRLFNEPDSARRKSLYLALGEFAVERTNRLRAQVVNESRDRLREFGFDDLGDYEEQRRGLSFDELEADVVSFLEDTDDIYFELTDSASREMLGRSVTEIEDYDRGRLFRGAEFDRYFPP
ncbi:MAG: hypothetical protein JXB46_03665, partial [Candidatus Eisenbacteria bacterium]|nr:hypothetical protein [Candidatus Eisenbacteria bacterium]